MRRLLCLLLLILALPAMGASLLDSRPNATLGGTTFDNSKDFLPVREAFQLKSQLRDVVGLENRYARSGGRIDMRERADLERRYNSISAKVRFEKHDRQHRW